MSLKAQENHLWFCRLRQEHIPAWGKGLLDQRAKDLGLSGWIVPLSIDREGNLIQSTWNQRENCLRAAPWLHLQNPLTPSQEIQIASQLKSWWGNKKTLTIRGKNFLFISGIKNLSHTKFSLKRFKISFQNTLIIGAEDEWKLQRNQGQIDGIIQTNLKGSNANPVNYLRNLKKAHHEMNINPRQMLIPAVNGVTLEEERLWTNASARNYQQWILQSSAWSWIRYLEYQEAPLCIDDWDSHQQWYGGRSQVKTHSVNFETQPPEEPAIVRKWGKQKSKNIAVMIHGFYLDTLQDILSFLPPGGEKNGIPGLDLYVSTPRSQIEEAQDILLDQGWPRAYLCGVSNRGRDIGPFLLNLVPEAMQNGHHSFVKIHTKKSPHLKGGDSWSRHLVGSLLNEKFLSNLNDLLKTDPEIGLFAPAGALLKSSVALGNNAHHIQRLLEKMDWSGAWALNQSYVAGSMMAGRLSTMQLFQQLELTIDNFEIEQGQTDGTLAHALERFISWQYAKKGLTIQTLPSKSPSVPQFGFGWV